MGKGSQTTTTGNAPPAYYQNAYQDLSQRAIGLSQQPYQPYGGQGVAPVNQTQLGALSQFQTAAQPLTQAQIHQYYNPYQQSVIDATKAQFANTNAQQFNQADANAVMAGAYGGTGNVRAKAMLTGQQQLAEAPVIAGLEQQGYQQAFGAAGQQFQQQPEAAAQFQYGVGTQEQQTEQAQANFAYQQYLAQQGYPYQNLAFATGQVGGLGSLAGGTGYVTAPPPNPWTQLAGVGATAAGAYLGARDGGRIPGLAGGGAPGNMPYAGAPSYVPVEPLPHGAGPPHPVSSPADTSSNQIFQNAAKMAGTYKGTGINSYGGGNALTDAYGGSASNPLEGLTAADYGVGGGGRIMPRAYGGLVLPQHSRIEYKHGGPIRGGLGFSSFIPRRGYQYGGSPEEGLSPADFNARFQGESPDLVGGTLPGVESIPVTTQPITPPDAGTIMQPGLEPPTVVPPSVPQATPVQTAGVDQAPAIVTRGPEAVTWEAKARRAAEAEGIDPNWFVSILRQESGLNPNVRPSRTGNVGIGQLGEAAAAEVGVNRNDPEQNLVGSARYAAKMLQKFKGDYPLATAAYNAGPGRVDYSQRTGAPLPRETQAYVPSVMAMFGQGPGEGAPRAGVGADENGYTPPPPPRERTSGLATGQERPSTGGFGLGPGSHPDLGHALMAAGFGMMASRSPFLGVGIGEGGMAGLGAYGSLQRQHLAEQHQAMEDQRAAEAQRHAQMMERLGERRLNEVSPGEKAKLEQEERFRNVPVGYRVGKDGALEAIPGGPQDPAVIKEQTKAKLVNIQSPESMEIAARRDLDGDPSGLNVGYGKDAQTTRNAIRETEARILREEYGMTPQQAADFLAKKKQEYAASGIGQNAAARTTGTREANLDLILKKVEADIPPALELSKKVWRTGMPPINKIIQKGQVMTSDADLGEFGMANLTLAEAWARSMNPNGIMRESDRDKALDFLSTAQSQPTYERLVRRLQSQIQREHAVVLRKAQQGAEPGGAAPSETGAPAEAAKPDIPTGSTHGKKAGVSGWLTPDGKFIAD